MPSENGPAHPGRFGDGKSAATSPVAVRLGQGGIEISGLGGTEPLVWPYAALATAAPLGRGARDVLVSYAHQKGASLFVDDATFATELAERAPQLTARALRLQHAKPWLLAFAGVLAVGCLLWMLNLSPANMVARLLPDATRTTLGGQVIRSMTAGRKICEAPAGRAALGTLVARLSGSTPGARRFKVIVVDWGLVNAFAAPGEQIVLTRGLINKAGGPDEVAAVLAHEMGHGIELHPETGLVRALGLSAAIELMSGGSSGTLANLGVMLAQFSYTRAAEREADAHALRLLAGSKISQQGIIDFFTRVEKLDGAGVAGNIDMLRTHPQIAERKQMAEAAPRYPATPALADADWQALRSICSL